MGRLPALPLLYWGLPVLSFGLGVIALVAIGLQLACRCGAVGAPQVLIALYFTLFGLTALAARWRGVTNLADASLLAIGLGAAALLLVGEVKQVSALRRPLQTVSGQMVSIYARQATGRYDAQATLELADGRRVTWSCGSFCRGRDLALKSLHGNTPMPVQMQLAGSRLVGLTADGVQILDPQIERQRQIGSHVLLSGLWSLVLAGLLMFGYFRWRRLKATYTRPPPTVLPKLRRLRP